MNNTDRSKAFTATERSLVTDWDGKPENTRRLLPAKTLRQIRDEEDTHPPNCSCRGTYTGPERRSSERRIAPIVVAELEKLRDEG